MDTTSFSNPPSLLPGAVGGNSAAAPAPVPVVPERGEEKEIMYRSVSPVRSVTAKRESSVLDLGMREGVGRRVLCGEERRAAHQGRERKWVRSTLEGAEEGVGMVAVLGGDDEGRDIGCDVRHSCCDCTAVIWREREV